MMMRLKIWTCWLSFGALALNCILGVDVTAQKLKIACVGNSITYGYDFSNPSTQSYPGQLQALLSTSQWEVGNFGDSGRSLLKGSGYSYWDSPLYSAALASNPNFVVLKLGTNDSKTWLWNWLGANFKKDYKDMVLSFQNLSSKPEMFICLLIPSENAGWEIFNADIRDKINPKIKEMALEMGLGLIDLYSVLDINNPDLYLADHVHPSVMGAGILAQKVNEMVTMPKPNVTYSNAKVVAPDGSDYQWYINDVPVADENGGKLKELPVTVSGFYKVSVKLNSTGESRIVSNKLYIAKTSVLSEANTINGGRICHQPNADILRLVTSDLGGVDTYRVADMNGSVILSGQLQDGNKDINVGTLSSGIYIFIVGNEQFTFVKK